MPPTHVLVAAYLGVGKKEEKGDLGDLFQMLNPIGTDHG